MLQDSKVYEEKVNNIFQTRPSKRKGKWRDVPQLKERSHKVHQTKITEKLKTLKGDVKLSYQQYIELKLQSETVPRIYHLPKVHKNPRDPPYRPIVDYTGSCTYKVEKAISNINPLIGKSEHLLNSKALVDKIKDEDEIWIISLKMPYLSTMINTLSLM